MTKTIHGRIHGKTIELEEDRGFADGEEVEVVMKAAKPRQPWGEGIKRSAGVAADMPEFDDVFARIERERKAATFRDEQS